MVNNVLTGTRYLLSIVVLVACAGQDDGIQPLLRFVFCRRCLLRHFHSVQGGDVAVVDVDVVRMLRFANWYETAGQQEWWKILQEYGYKSYHKR